LGGIVVECACVVELKFFIDPPPESELPSQSKMLNNIGHGDILIWGLISEDILNKKGDIPQGYVDDGEEH
jgi:hypothetical protein